MHSYSLVGSPSSSRLNQQISYSQVTKEYLENKNDNLIETLNELIDESDPKERYGKIVARRRKELDDLKAENKKLLQIVKGQEEDLFMARNQIQRLRLLCEDEEKMDMESPPSVNNSSSSSGPEGFPSYTKAICPEYQQEVFQGIEIMEEETKQLVRTEQQAIEKCMLLLEVAFQKLGRMAQFQKITQQSIQSKNFYERKETILIQKEKYEKLIDYYVQTVVIPTKKSQNQGQVQQFEAQGHEQKDKSPKVNLILKNGSDFEIMFAKIAESHNLKNQWEQFLTNRKQEGQRFKNEIQQIFKGEKKDREIIYKDINLMNSTISTFLSNTQNDSLSRTALQVVNTAEQEIQDILFKNLINLVDRLQVTETQKEILKRVDQKRKCGRYFDIDEFLQKFKNQQDVAEISQEYANYTLKMMNSFVIKTMEVLFEQSHSNSNNLLEETPLKWLKLKLDKSYSNIKNSLFTVLERKSSQFLSQKHQILNLSNEQKIKNRKQVQPLPNPKFDKNKELEKELVKIVFEYKQVFESCIVNSNKRLLARVL